MEDLFRNSLNDASKTTPAEVLRATRMKLYTMFCSPMKEEYLHEAFTWVSNLCISNGNQFWTEDKTNWTEEDARIFSCIARLSLGEFEILLPLIKRHLTWGDETEVEDGKLLDRSANSADYDRFGNHLVILESVIKCLVEGQDLYEDDEDEGNQSGEKQLLTNFIKGNEMINLLDRLKEVMVNICDYLEIVHRNWSNLIKEIDSEKFSSAKAALRIISIWLSEEPEAFKSQCERFIVDLLVKNLLIESPSKEDLYVLALHSVCSQDKDLKNILDKLPGHEQALQRYLDFVQKEQSKCSKKIFKLRCGLIKDLLN